jgi:sulfur relay (sulfurtransferase) DsrF/TusC family protein
VSRRTISFALPEYPVKKCYIIQKSLKYENLEIYQKDRQNNGKKMTKNLIYKTLNINVISDQLDRETCALRCHYL